MSKNVVLILILSLYLSTNSIGQTKQDSLINLIEQDISVLKMNDLIIDSLKSELRRLNSRYDYQLKINEQTLNSISNQIGATSFNLTVFGILFSIAALGLGIYVTYIERKTANIREQTRDLLKDTIKTKDEVEQINELIQKDINGLFLKIKREETVYILRRLLKVPRDIGNLSNELLSRELEKEDFDMLKKAYLNLKSNDEDAKAGIRISLEDKDQYKLLFFQHFLDLSIKDETIGPELIEFYPEAITCAFENDIIKSTEDFIKAIIDKGFQNCQKEINSYFIGISKSDFRSLDQVYEILFNGLKDRTDRFKFFELITNEKDARVGKTEFGNMLKVQYGETNLTESEKIAIEKVVEIEKELHEEEMKRKEAVEKAKKAQEESKRNQEERKKSKENSN